MVCLSSFVGLCAWTKYEENLGWIREMKATTTKLLKIIIITYFHVFSICRRCLSSIFICWGETRWFFLTFSCQANRPITINGIFIWWNTSGLMQGSVISFWFFVCLLLYSFRMKENYGCFFFLLNHEWISIRGCSTYIDHFLFCHWAQIYFWILME